MHDKDFLSAQRQTGLRKMPQEVIDEYEIVANMLARDGVTKPIGPIAINAVLRRCGLAAPTELRPAEVADVKWETVPPKSRIIVRRTENDPRGGILLRSKTNGCLEVMLDGDVAVREYAQRYCTLDAHWSDDPWSTIEPGRPVFVHKGNRDCDAKFVALVDSDTVRVLFKKGEEVVSKDIVRLAA